MPKVTLARKIVDLSIFLERIEGQFPAPWSRPDGAHRRLCRVTGRYWQNRGCRK
jgi:hypothetical protein